MKYVQALNHNEIVGLIVRTRSLRRVRERFPGGRTAVLKALSDVGFDFGALLEEQFREGKSDVELSALHNLSTKWIAAERKKRGFDAKIGRPAKTTTDNEILAAFEKHGNYSAAARRLRLNRETFTRRYKAAIAGKAGDGGSQAP